jgi:hypothetical protein
MSSVSSDKRTDFSFICSYKRAAFVYSLFVLVQHKIVWMLKMLAILSIINDRYLVLCQSFADCEPFCAACSLEIINQISQSVSSVFLSKKPASSTFSQSNQPKRENFKLMVHTWRLELGETAVCHQLQLQAITCIHCPRCLRACLVTVC